MEETKGRFHILFVSFPQRTPSIREYAGLTMKNNSMHNAIPEHSGANLATANGNANITAIVTAIHIIISLRLPIAADFQFRTISGFIALISDIKLSWSLGEI
mgnify:CR=1 FL=1